MTSVVFADPSDPAVDRSETELRVDGWLRDGRARGDVERGRVAPAYRALERRLDADLVMTKDVVQPRGWTGGMLAQAHAFFGRDVRTPPASPIQRAIEPRDTPLGVEEGSYVRAAAGADVSRPTRVRRAAMGRGGGCGRRARRRQHRRDLARALRDRQRSIDTRLPVPRAARLVFAVRGAYTATLPAIAFTFDECGTLPGHGVDRFIKTVNPVEQVDKQVVLLAVFSH